MSRRCELSGTGVQYGNKVSHSQRKTRRRFEPNMRQVRFISDLIGEEFKFRVNARCMRSIEKIGGFDQYMIASGVDNLSQKAQVVKRKIMDKRKESLV